MDEKKKPNTGTGSTGQTLEQLCAELERMRKQASHFDAHAMWSDRELKAQHRELLFVRRKVRRMVGVAAGLAVMLIGGAIWTFDKIEAGEAALAALPDPASFVQAVDDKVDRFAEQLADLSADGDIMAGFADRIAALESNTTTTLDTLRREVERSSTVEAEVRLDTARRIDAMGPRLEAAEVLWQQASAEVVELEREVAEMRSAVAEELALLRLGNAEFLQAVERRVRGNERGLEAVSWEIGRERLDFELFEDHRLEVAPGVVLNVSDTDVAYQKVDGWLHLTKDGRILRLEDHPVQQSLVFYGPDDERSYELVFTGIRPDVAVGYVRVPDDDGVRIVNHLRDPEFNEQASAIR